MSILIKGMEMPKYISAIVFVNPDGAVHYQIKGEVGFHYTTAVEIPDGHGRLIDADVLEKKFCSHCDEYMSGAECEKENCSELKFFKSMPTVIPSDKDGET